MNRFIAMFFQAVLVLFLVTCEFGKAFILRSCGRGGSKLFGSDSSSVVSLFDDSILALKSGHIQSIRIPFPSSIIPRRFNTKKEIDGRKYFDYMIRESFQELLSEVVNLTDDDNELDSLTYIGNVGSGKSHNLAALVFYLRTCRSQGDNVIDQDIVYISDCGAFFSKNSADSLQMVLIESFPDDADILLKLESWDDLLEYVLRKPEKSILFIFDDFNYVLPEEKMLPIEQQERNSYQQKLNDLASFQYRIVGISAFSEFLTSSSSSCDNRQSKKINLFGGLSDVEWNIWKKRSNYFVGLSPEDERELKDFTGLVPLYLNAIDAAEGDLENRTYSFATDLIGLTIESNLKYSSDKLRFKSRFSEEVFLNQMKNAVCEIGTVKDVTLYDHRYFYYEKDKVLKPVSGFVRKIMNQYLLQDKDTKN